MSELLYALTADDVMRLKRLLRAHEAGELRTSFDTANKPFFLQHAKGGFLKDVVGAQETMFGPPDIIGTVAIYDFSTTGFFATGEEVDAYQFSTVAITTDIYVQIRMAKNGKWVIYGAECP